VRVAAMRQREVAKADPGAAGPSTSVAAVSPQTDSREATQR
jgi:hypothetical protein